MEIDRDGEMTVEMARTLLWEHQGIEITGRNTLVFTASAPSAPGKRGAGQPGSPGRRGAIRAEFVGMSASGLPGPARRDAGGAGARSALLHRKSWPRPHGTRRLPHRSAVPPRESTHPGGTGDHPRRQDANGRKAASARAAATATAATGHA